jgi:arginyl-tRNA synthetase
MNLFTDFEARIKTALEQIDLVKEKRSELDFGRIAVEPPRDPSHGDVATNAAMVLAKPLGRIRARWPRSLPPSCKEDPDVADVRSPARASSTSRSPSATGSACSASMIERHRLRPLDARRGRKVNVEYVSANPTGPMHVGHCRGAVVGDALANLLAFAGYDVTKEYYINDAGSQIDVLARSVFLRYREALGEKIGEIPAGLYPGDYLVPVGEALARDYGVKLHNMPEDEWMPLVKDRTIDAMMVMIREDLARSTSITTCSSPSGRCTPTVPEPSARRSTT